MKQLIYRLPLKRIKESKELPLMEVVRIREKEWRPVRWSAFLLLACLLAFGLFIWVGGSVVDYSAYPYSELNK